MFMRMLASPSMSITSRPGLANCAPIAAGRPKPIVPMLPEVSHSRGVAEVEHLRGPHLVLADAGGDDRLAARVPVDLLDHVVRLDQLAGAVVVHRVALLERAQCACQAPIVALRARRCCTARAAARSASGSRPDVAPVRALDLVDLGSDRRRGARCARAARANLLRIAGHAVVEARTDRDQEIAVLDRVVRERGAVHAEHAHRERMRWCRSRRCPSAS